MEEVLGTPVGRLAPSPTGALHLGNVRTFMIAWLHARAAGGRLILRMEDLDHPKDKPGAAAQAIDDLRWLGFDWDAEYVQSERKAIYRAALDYLRSQSVSTGDPAQPLAPLVYPCVCSRRDVEAAQSAPHTGEQLHYAGTCRMRFASYDAATRFLNPSGTSTPPRLPCWRFRVPDGTRVVFEDGFAGRFEADVAATLGDFPLARDPDGAGYTLAVVVDDLLMGVTEVIRGDDLLGATPAQLLIAQALTGFISNFQRSTHNSQLSYYHIPLVVGPDGKRLAKRHGDTRVASFRQEGWTPERLIGELAASCGWCAEGESISLADLLPRFTLDTIPHHPYTVPSSLSRVC